MPEEQGTWVAVQPGDLAAGDRVRGSFPHSVVEGVVSHHYAGMGNQYVRLDRGGEVASGWSYSRTWERWVPVVPEYTWEPVDASAVREGMYVRGTPLPRYNVTEVEGYVERLRGDREVRVSGRQFVYLDRRSWSRRVPAEQEQAATSAAPVPVFAAPEVGEVFNRTYDNGSEPRRGCRVTNVTQRRTGGWYVGYSWEGSTNYASSVLPDGTITSGMSRGRFERSSTGRWVPIAGDALRVGMRVRGTPTPEAVEARDVPEGEIVEGVINREPRTYGADESYIYLDGVVGNKCVQWRTWEQYTTEPAAPVTGWVLLVPSELRVGDTVQAAPHNIGGLMQATVISLSEDGERFRAQTTHVLEPSSNGQRSDMLLGSSQAGYSYRFATMGDAVVWRGEGAPPAHNQRLILAPQVGEYFTRTFDAPDGQDRERCRVVTVHAQSDGWRVEYQNGAGPIRRHLVVRWDGTAYDSRDRQRWPGRFVRGMHAPVAESAPVTDVRPLPEWATSLDAAKRYVYDAATELERRGANCLSGTNDFLSAADLPSVEEGYPDPAVTEEAEIREFMVKAREAALSTARSHGKSMAEVERWLEQHGLTAPPPPMQNHTFTVRVPAGTEVGQVIRDLGWEVV